MKITDFCQSCGMPLDGPDLRGHEKDGSLSNDYCKYCYRDGSFTNPDLTPDEMRAHIIAKMEKEKIPADIIETVVLRLPFLNRWKNHSIQAGK